MKLLIQNGRIVATATDDYTGPDTHITAPDGFDLARMGEYQVAPDALVIPAKPLSHVDFMDRFTDEEMEAIYSAATASVKVQVWLDRFRLSSFVDVTDPRTVAVVQALEVAGLIAAGRSAEILVGEGAVVLSLVVAAPAEPGPDAQLMPAPETVQ